MVALVVALAGSTAVAQRNLKDIPPPDPELERKSFRLPEGFEVNLFAADPKIAKPIQMNFDPQGRLWIASSKVYPHIEPGQEADDEILVLEDTDGDGVCDETTVFAGGLLIPTGVVPGDGGAYVANSTELLHLSDTDGDGKADEERVVLSGFGTEDTHHILHTFRWSPAGYLTFNQSIYIHSHVETPYGVRRLNGGGIWWFRPETLRLEVFARGLINPWGNAWTDRGVTFATDGAGGEGINYVVPGAYYRTAVGAKRILHGLNPGSPKYCGLEVVDGRHLPEEWRGNLITHDFRGHRVCRFVVEEDGAGFVSRQMPDLISSDHVAFRPVDVKMGPDGAIYIADWYNPIIQHGEVDFRDPRRDHTHGRIWRITYSGNETLPRPKLAEATVPELLDALKSPEGWTRRNARRVLKERGREAVLPELRTWVAKLEDADDPQVERHRLNALWVSHALREADAGLLSRCLESPDGGVRAAAVRVLSYWVAEGPAAGVEPLPLLKARVRDAHPRVRLEAVRALARVDDPQAVEVATQVLDREMDEFLDYALWLTARETRDGWLPELATGRVDFDGDAERLLFAIEAAESPQAVPTLLAVLEREKLPADHTAEAVDLLATLGGRKELQRVMDLVLSAETSPERRRSLLRTLNATRRAVRPAGNLVRLGELFGSNDADAASLAMSLAGKWKVQGLRAPLTAIATDDEAAEGQRVAALEALVDLGGQASAAVLRELARSDSPVDVRMEAAAGLVTLAPKTGAEESARLLSGLQGVDPTPLFNAILARKGAAQELASALEGAKLPEDTAKLGLRAVSAAGRPEPELQSALQAAGGIQGGPTKLTDTEMAALVEEVEQDGDAHRGEAVFRRDDLACLKCHAVGGAGGRVGPDMVSLGASAQVDYLIESLLDPNAKVKENYHTLIVVTDAGKVVSGVPVRKTDRELVLRDAEDREVAVPLGSIEEQRDGASIMPAGLTQSLTRQELVDLVRFLSELGKTGEFRIGREPVARRWRVMLPTKEASFRLRRTSFDTAATNDPAYTWGPTYSRVDGVLPLADLPEVRVRNRVAAGEKGVAFARAELDVTSAGKVGLVWNSVRALQVWVDGEPVTPAERMELDLPKGRHRLTVAVDLSEREAGLRLAAFEVADSPGRAVFTAGK